MKTSTAVLALVALLPCLSQAKKRTFSPSTAFFLSPERGFYNWLDSLESATAGDAAWIRSSGYTLAHARIRLDDYKNTATLPSSLLDNIQTGFDAVRAAGIKVVIRCVYNYPTGEFDYNDAEDAPLDITLSHIQQIGPVVKKNADVVAVVQGGFVGAWGEQHTSSNGNDEPGPLLEIRNALQAEFPSSRAILWRYPAAIMPWGLKKTQNKIGLYNDCFMSSDTDVGTYSSDASERAVERAFAASVSNWTPYGGETCNAGSGKRSTCADILREGKEFHLSYLNAAYYTGFHDQWKNEGCFSEVERDMGYRIYVRKANAPTNAAVGESVALWVTLRNVGWSRLFNFRKFHMVLVQGDSKILVRLRGRNPKNIAPLDQRGRKYKGTWTPPSSTTGTFSLYLISRDNYSSLQDDPRYNLRFANDEPWDTEMGMLDLGMTISIA